LQFHQPPQQKFCVFLKKAERSENFERLLSVQGVVCGQTVVCIHGAIFGVVGQFPQGIVLTAHLIRIATWHVGGEQDAAEQRIDPGQGLLLL
jgi:hypothetical protein